MQLIHDLPKKARRDREIKYQIIGQPFIAVFLQTSGQIRIRFGVRQIALMISQVCSELLPLRVIHRLGAGIPLEPLAHFGAPTRIGLFPTGKSHYPKRLWHLSLLVQMKQCWNQLARRQVTTRAKNHNRTRLIRLTIHFQPRQRRIQWGSILCHEQRK